jgi:hypothetical protein
MAKRPRGERIQQLKMAYDIARETDRMLPLWLAGSVVVTLAVFLTLGFTVGPLWLWIVLGVIASPMVAMIVLSRRVNSAVYTQLDGQPDAAARILTGMRGQWTVTHAVQIDKDQNLVHRVVGRPGVVLVAEGRSPARLRQMLVTEKRNITRVAVETPVYDVIVGEDAGQVSLKKLQNHLQKLPRNLRPAQVRALSARMRALKSTPPMPKGPIPTGRMPRNRIR